MQVFRNHTNQPNPSVRRKMSRVLQIRRALVARLKSEAARVRNWHEQVELE